MSRNDGKRLDDIRTMCAHAATIVDGGRLSVESDPVRWMALERAIEIAGEAATQLSGETRERYPDVAWRQLIAVRVILAHAYHRVDLDLLWGIASTDLPAVAAALGPLSEGKSS